VLKQPYIPSANLTTPAVVYNQAELQRCASGLRSFASDMGATLLYSVKACPLRAVLEEVAPFVAGFSVSSLNEAKLSGEVAGASLQLHYISPHLPQSNIAAIAHHCRRITVNSLSALRRFRDVFSGTVELGLRINPQMSFVDDKRYDPCGPASRLGVPLFAFRNALEDEPGLFAGVSGIHVHSNCDSSDLGHLAATIQHVTRSLGARIDRFSWWNLGGGYSFSDACGRDELHHELMWIKARQEIQFILEPGAAFVRSAGMFVTTVEDLIGDGEVPTALLDMSVNHWPEVFEYQFEPDVAGHNERGGCRYVLAGCSCLAGDRFGEYSFDEPLTVGSQVVFINAGAYSVAKSHMFNGIDLPTMYLRDVSGEDRFLKRFGYSDFASLWGADARAVV
jgi:carboxynorspermidine decarboxylase